MDGSWGGRPWSDPGPWPGGRGSTGLRRLAPRAAFAGGAEHQARWAALPEQPPSCTAVVAALVLGVRVEPVGFALAEGVLFKAGAVLRFRRLVWCGDFTFWGV